MSPSTKMNIFTGLVSLFGSFAAVVAETNEASTSTLPPQPLGSSSAGGAMLVSMNYCSVIYNTVCQVSVITHGAPPPADTGVVPPPVATTDGSVAAVETTNPPPNSVPAVTKFTVPAHESMPSVTETHMSKPTESSSSEEDTWVVTEPVETETKPVHTAQATSSKPLTAAAAGVKAFPGAAWGAAILAILCLI